MWIMHLSLCVLSSTPSGGIVDHSHIQSRLHPVVIYKDLDIHSFFSFLRAKATDKFKQLIY